MVDLKSRTKQFALGVIGLVRAFPRGIEGQVIGRQLLRAATSVGANYRASQRAKSKADFISKMSTVEEEADECCFWLEIALDAKVVAEELAQPLLGEANELTAIVVSAIKTAKANRP